MSWRTFGMGGLLGVLTLGLLAFSGRPVTAVDDRDEALERARREVKKLDTLYKTAAVSITERFPRGQPAIMVANDIFKVMADGKHHSAKLVDATGSPLGENNEPATDFEKRAANAMNAGETYLEEVVGEGDDRRLLAATVLPAVHKRCAECHGVKEGDLLGFVRYEVPIGRD